MKIPFQPIRLGATLLLIGLAAQATAGAASPPRTMAVRFSEQELQHPEGARAVYLRIRAAAAEVCATNGVTSLLQTTRYMRCHREAIEKAVAEVNRPLLTVTHGKRSGVKNRQMAGGARFE